MECLERENGRAVLSPAWKSAHRPGHCQAWPNPSKFDGTSNNIGIPVTKLTRVVVESADVVFRRLPLNS